MDADAPSSALMTKYDDRRRSAAKRIEAGDAPIVC
jgi:hypothetical protein